MHDRILILLGVWTVLQISVILDVVRTSYGFSIVNPMVIYNNIKVNWFGVVILTILINIFLPIMAIMYWMYKLCTIGRNTSE